MGLASRLHLRRLSCVGVMLGAALVCAAAAAAQPGKKRALLIGINDYRNVPPLQGSLNDVDGMQAVLIARWGFAREDIAVLEDGAATRAGILAALNELVRAAQPDDFVYVHYSGHGSQVKDLNGDEADGLDETIVPVDGRGDGVPDITDDELDTLLGRLRAREAVIVLDSCHSGTATRAIDVHPRSVPADTRVELYRDNPAVGARAIVPGVATKYVLFSAAASNEEALDGPIDGRYHGFFSYALSRSVAGHSPGASPREIFAGAEAELGQIQGRYARMSMPDPQLEGPAAILDRPLLADGSASAALLSVNNPTAKLRVEIGVVAPETIASRDIIAADRLVTGQYRIRRANEPRTINNSLQLDIRASSDAYFTVVDIDAAGSVTLLFPTEHQNPQFLPQGFVRGGMRARIPDSLESGNQAGFHWDYGEPSGVDTLRVFASADLATAKLIRARILGMSALNVQTATRALAADLGSSNARGIAVVADKAVPASASAR